MKISTLTIEMAANVARLRQDMEHAQKTVDKAMGGITSAVKMAGAVFAALGVGVSLSALVGWVRGAIDAADAASKLAQKTGLAVKEVGGLQLAFRQAGVGDKLQDTLAKLSKEAANSNKAFAAMGVQVNATDGSLKSTRVLLGEVAEKFSGYKDSAEKTALAQELFGRSGAELIPLLNAGAGALDEYDKTAAALGLTLDKDTEQAAEKFNDTLDLVGQSTKGVSMQIAAKLLPTLNVLAGELLGMVTKTDFVTTASDALAFSFKALYSIGVGLGQVFRTMITWLNGYGSAIAAILAGDFGAVKLVAAETAQKISESWANAGASIQRTWSDTGNSTIETMAALNAQAKDAAPKVDKLAAAHKGAAKATREEAEALRARLAAAQSNNAAFDEEFKQVEALRLATEGRIKSAREMLEAIERETAMLGLSNLEREQAIALFELERAGVVAGTEAYDAYAKKIEEALGAKASKQAGIDLAKTQADAYTAALKKQADETQKFWDSVDATAHDVFVSVADEGMDAFKRIGKTLKAAILDMLYQMTLKKWIFQISGNFNSGGVNGGGMVSNLSSAYSAYTTAGFGGAGGGAGAVGGSASAVGSYLGGSMSGANAAGSIYANTTGTGISGLLSTNGAYGTASTSGAAAGASSGWMAAAGWAALVVVAIKIADGLYKKGWNRDALGDGKAQRGRIGQYSTYNSDPRMGKTLAYDGSIEKINRQMGDALGLSKKWSDILSGSVRMAHLFGRKLDQYGMQANFANGQVDVSGYAKYKGGVFRSNKTVAVDLDPRDVELFRMQVESFKNGTRSMAAAMGMNTDAVDNYTGTLKVNFKGVKSNEEAAERMAKAMDDMQFAMLKAAAGGQYSREEFTRTMEAAKADMQAVGISAQGISDILVAGIMGRMTESEVGAALSDMIVGGIYESIASNYAGMIATAFTQQIIQPIFVAIAAGVPISQAISQSAISNIVATAQQAAAAMNAIFSDPGFRAAISGIELAISGISGSVARVKIPSFGSAKISAANNAAQKANQIAQEKFQLETKLLGLLGNTAKLRERELNAIAASNRYLQIHIWAVEDAKSAMDTAMDALRRAIEAQQDSINKQLDAARKTEGDLNDIFGLLRDNIRELRGEVEATAIMQAEAARAMIRNAVANMEIPSNQLLTDAISSARAAVENGRYSTSVEQDRARLTLANELAALQGVVQPQLSAAEQQVLLLEGQLESLELQLKVAEDQMNALLGIDNSVKTVTVAVDNLSNAMGSYAQAVAAAAAITVAAIAPANTAPVTGGGGYSAPKVSAPKVWTAAGYWAKNKDLQTYYNANQGALNAQFGGRDQYLQWHWQTFGQGEKRKYSDGGYTGPGGKYQVAGLVHAGEVVFSQEDIRRWGGVQSVESLRTSGRPTGALGGDAETKAILRQMLSRLEHLEATSTSTAVNTGRSAALSKRVTRNGTAMVVVVDAEVTL